MSDKMESSEKPFKRLWNVAAVLRSCNLPTATDFHPPRRLLRPRCLRYSLLCLHSRTHSLAKEIHCPDEGLPACVQGVTPPRALPWHGCSGQGWPGRRFRKTASLFSACKHTATEGTCARSDMVPVPVRQSKCITRAFVLGMICVRRNRRCACVVFCRMARSI
jgi:hypothetical protein